MYSNTKVGDFLAGSNPKTLKVQPAWAKSLGGEVNIVADKIKITDSGEQIVILSGTFGNLKYNITSSEIDYYCNSIRLHLKIKLEMKKIGEIMTGRIIQQILRCTKAFTTLLLPMRNS